MFFGKGSRRDNLPKNEKTQILRFRYISNAPAASCSHVSFSGQRLFVSTSTGQHTKNSHRLATLHFSFCVADKPSYPCAGLAKCARCVSVRRPRPHRPTPALRTRAPAPNTVGLTEPAMVVGGILRPAADKTYYLLLLPFAFFVEQPRHTHNTTNKR